MGNNVLYTCFIIKLHWISNPGLGITGPNESRFGCQPDRKSIENVITPLAVKRQRLETITECEREIGQVCHTQSFSIAEVRADPSTGKQY